MANKGGRYFKVGDQKLTEAEYEEYKAKQKKQPESKSKNSNKKVSSDE